MQTAAVGQAFISALIIAPGEPVDSRRPVGKGRATRRVVLCFSTGNREAVRREPAKRAVHRLVGQVRDDGISTAMGRLTTGIYR
ncbi:hypothetical protein D3C81_937110 [compost metagenome]